MRADESFCTLLLQLVGGVILGVGLWMRHDPKTSSLMGLEFDGAQVPNTFYMCTYHVCFARFLSSSLVACFFSRRSRSYFIKPDTAELIDLLHDFEAGANYPPGEVF